MFARAPAPIASSAAFLATPDSGRQEQVRVIHHKEPLLAGILGLYIPGGGSFYAGHSKHGWMHVGGFVVSGLMMYAASADCHDCSVNTGVGVLGFLGMGVNVIWSAVSGVNDANAYNALKSR